MSENELSTQKTQMSLCKCARHSLLAYTYDMINTDQTDTSTFTREQTAILFRN